MVSGTEWRPAGAGEETTRDEAAEVWRGVASGRWSLTEMFDSGERRFIVVRRLDSPAPTERLTRRQREILSCASRGWSNKTISFHLGLTASTVSTHVAEAARRLGVDCRVRAVQAFRLSSSAVEAAGE